MRQLCCPIFCVRPLLWLGSVVPLLFASCGWVFFYPSRQLYHLPTELGVEYREVTFSSTDGTQLFGWWLPAQGEEKGRVLFLHGNAENISTHVAAVAWLPSRGYSVFLFDYRGYGASEGSAGIDGALEDSEAAIRYMTNIGTGEFHLFGQSLGGSLSLLAAASSPEKSKILSVTVEGAFSSFRGIIADKVGSFWLLWPLQRIPGLFVFAEAPKEAVKRIPDCPLLVIHGEADEIVPDYHASRIFDPAHEPKTLWRIPNGRHTDTFSRPEYRDRFVAFLSSVAKK